MIVVRLAYPARPQGSHKGVPLRQWARRRSGMSMIVVRLAYPARPEGSHKGVPLRRRVRRRGGMSMVVVRLAYPARPEGSHKGVPLRGAWTPNRLSRRNSSVAPIRAACAT